MIKAPNGKKYAIDMTKLMVWVSQTPSSEKNIVTQITETYPMQTGDDENFDVASKEITESKTTLNEVMNNIRYDFIKMILQPIILNDNDTHSFSQSLCFNTLLKEGIIIEIND